MPGRRKKEKGREEGRLDKDSGERRIRSQIAQDVIAGIKEKASVHDGIKEAVQRPVVQSFMRSWDCSQIENEEEEKIWREGDQMAAQFDEEQRTKMDGRNLFAVGGHAKGTGPSGQERMSQGKKCKHGETRGKKKFKSKLACILEESLPNYHEDHIAGKGDNSLQHYNLVQIYSYASSQEDSRSKSSSG